jgi:hypothetical protein
MILTSSTVTTFDDINTFNVKSTLSHRNFDRFIEDRPSESTNEYRTSSFNDDMSSMLIDYSFMNSSTSVLPREVIDYNNTKKTITEFEKNFLKLEEYSSFEHDWYGEGELPFTKRTIEVSKEILPLLLKQPEIFPARDGSIQLEFENEDSSNYFQINICGNIILLYADFKNFEFEKKYDFSINKKNILKIINMYIKVF